MMTLIGDGMLVSNLCLLLFSTSRGSLSLQIYRCIVIFSYQWLIIILPVMLWLGNAICSAAIIYISATLRTNALLNVNQLSPFLTAFLVITLVTNLLTTGTVLRHSYMMEDLLTACCTGLIVWKIWSVDREGSRYQVSSPDSRRGLFRRSRLSNVIRIVVESGLLYTTLVLVTFGTEVAGSNALYGVSDVVRVPPGLTIPDRYLTMSCRWLSSSAFRST